MGTAVVELTGVGAGHGGVPVLRGLDLTIRRGSILALLGHSGAGKSTLLRLLDGTLTADEGTLHFPDGAPRRAVALQQPQLFPWLTVRENIELGTGFASHRRACRTSARIAEAVEALGLADLLDRYPDQLSGGQAQRVGLARAWAVEAQLLLLDEPLSALDPATRSGVQEWLVAGIREAGATALLVTHDIDEALLMGDEVHLLAGGRLQRTWRPDAAARRARGELWHDVRAAYDADHSLLEPAHV